MEATSNWPSESELHLRDILQETDTLPSGELVDLLDEDKCISLTKPEGGKSEEGGCIVRLGILPPPPFNTNAFSPYSRRLLTGFSILSEARVLEVCTGPHDEYLKTAHGILMKDFGDSKIFKCEVQFEKFQDTVQIKLKGTCHEDSVWIFGFFITSVVDIEGANGHSRNRFGRENLSSVLQEKDVQMSKEAMKFRQMLESYNSVRENGDTQAGNPMNLMSMMFGSMLPMGKTEMYNGTPGETNFKKKKKYEDEIESVMNKVELESRRVKEMQDGNQDGTLKIENGLKHLALFSENRTKGNNVCSVKKSENGMESPLQMNRFLEKMQNYMSDSSAGPKSMMELTNILQKSVGVEPALSSTNESGKSIVGGKLWNSNMQLAESLQDGDLSCKFAEGNIGAAIQQQNSMKDADFRLLIHFEKILDDKLAAMEERLMKKFEEKLVARAGAESARLDHIEGLLEKILEKL